MPPRRLLLPTEPRILCPALVPVIEISVCHVGRRPQPEKLPVSEAQSRQEDCISAAACKPAPLVFVSTNWPQGAFPH